MGSEPADHARLIARAVTAYNGAAVDLGSCTVETVDDRVYVVLRSLYGTVPLAVYRLHNGNRGLRRLRRPPAVLVEPDEDRAPIQRWAGDDETKF